MSLWRHRVGLQQTQAKTVPVLVELSLIIIIILIVSYPYPFAFHFFKTKIRPSLWVILLTHEHIHKPQQNHHLRDEGI